MNRIAIAILLAILATDADARPRRQASSTYAAVPSGGDTSTAQGVAEIMASTGRLAHMGGNNGTYEGIGTGHSPSAALDNCCYSRSGMPVVDQGVAYGHGRWFACRRYGR